MADRVHTTMERDELVSPYARRDRPLPDPRGEQLRPRNNPVLPGGDRRDQRVTAAFGAADARRVQNQPQLAAVET